MLRLADYSELNQRFCKFGGVNRINIIIRNMNACITISKKEVLFR